MRIHWIIRVPTGSPYGVRTPKSMRQLALLAKTVCWHLDL